MQLSIQRKVNAIVMCILLYNACIINTTRATNNSQEGNPANKLIDNTKAFFFLTLDYFMDNFKLINLNVGGYVCTTYYDTLKRSIYFQNLVLQEKAESAFVNGNDDKEFFIDRDGDAFQDVMQYLRTYELPVKDIERLKILRSEATFYKFNDMVKKIDEAILFTKKNNICYSVKPIFMAFDTIKMNESGQLKPMKNNSIIVAAYQTVPTYGAQTNYKVIIKSCSN
ncbi:hypothetical protein [Parasitella parasitica]|uniref:Potassium channel tetramerisation-type BTB domain-containing protein n=1 Tax=Parasitella parasitica TaxID=35722 RepID=A0A0B7NUZ7_9FUNG|nr:hypothetical protein [Parasitella parasitica]